MPPSPPLSDIANQMLRESPTPWMGDISLFASWSINAATESGAEPGVVPVEGNHRAPQGDP